MDGDDLDCDDLTPEEQEALVEWAEQQLATETFVCWNIAAEESLLRAPARHCSKPRKRRQLRRGWCRTAAALHPGTHAAATRSVKATEPG